MPNFKKRSFSQVGNSPMKRSKTIKPFRRRNTFTTGARSGPELKNKDNSFSISSVTSLGTTTLLNSMAIGTEDGQRVGRKITIKSIEYRATISNSVANLNVSGTFPQNADAVRSLIVLDLQTDGTLPDVSSVLNGTGGQGASSSLRNAAEFERYKVLSDEVVTLDPSNNIKYIKKYIPCNIVTTFSLNSATLSSMLTNPIYHMLIDNNGAFGNFTLGRIFTRLRYNDM